MAEATTLPWYMTTGNFSNGTEYVTKNPMLYKAYNITLMVTTSFIMFSMGSSVNWKLIKPNLKKPIGPIIGMICQLILLPLICFCFAMAFSWDGELAIGMMIMASSPGGAISNIYTFWSRGDLPLSVTMTVFSTTLAMGFVPFNMFIYTQAFTDDDLVIPYLEMFFTVAYTWVAAALGVAIGWKLPKVGVYISKIGSVLGFLLIILSGIFQAQLYPEVFQLPWSVWFLGVLIPTFAYGMGVGMAYLAKLKFKDLKYKQAMTIGFETGMQNAAVALTMIAISYTEQEQGYYVQYPLLYSAWMVVEGFIIMCIHRFIYRYNERRCICQVKNDQKQLRLEFLENKAEKSSLSSFASDISEKSTKEKIDMGKGRFKITNMEGHVGLENNSFDIEKFDDGNTVGDNLNNGMVVHKLETTEQGGASSNHNNTEKEVVKAFVVADSGLSERVAIGEAVISVTVTDIASNDNIEDVGTYM